MSASGASGTSGAMTGVDTNVLLRFILDDDPRQHPIARRFFTERTRADPAFIPAIVLIEAIWYLRRIAKVDARAVADTFQKLLSVDSVKFEDQDFIRMLFADEEAVRGGLADRLIARACERHGCSRMVTFDQHAAKTIPVADLLA
ncbi:PIN domain-containing protein [Jiella sonneratiae]|uniref:Type II toxin-antitoxin system VapC family toxin n=1 Tax=Jiella sonneratiae TaxID=2816856 RepID=A0ABS3J6F5_9HYPH|nr:type II toxin-antitoxin system VapC family toxin [Jiella sonneratiae]MBO0905251.1 type II toxin-antitoxin system VapC family toxin [Jiella sonneratiae]